MMRDVATCLALSSIIGCGSHPHTTFHPTSTFAPQHGVSPMMVVRAADYPSARLRSVGLIEVRATSPSEAIDRARGKASEVGCPYVVDHHLFVEHRANVEIGLGAHVYLAHGTLSAPATRVSPRSRYVFDCAVEDTAPARA